MALAPRLLHPDRLKGGCNVRAGARHPREAGLGEQLVEGCDHGRLGWQRIRIAPNMACMSMEIGFEMIRRPPRMWSGVGRRVGGRRRCGAC